jgi:hypothetical protein
MGRRTYLSRTNLIDALVQMIVNHRQDRRIVSRVWVAGPHHDYRSNVVPNNLNDDELGEYLMASFFI